MYLIYTLMVLKVTQIAPEVIFVKPEVTWSNRSEIFISGNDFCGSFNVFLMHVKDFCELKSVKNYLFVHKNTKM